MQAEEPQAGTGADPQDDRETERARRYLDLWERHLAFLAVNGPLPQAGRAGPAAPPRGQW